MGKFWLLSIVMMCSMSLFGQKISGVIIDPSENEPLIGANVIIKGTSTGTVTDFDGNFELKVSSFPVTVEVSYIGYQTKDITFTSEGSQTIEMGTDDNLVLETVEVKGQRISDKQKAAPLTVESLDLAAIKATPADNFYDGLGNLKGVDLTAASLGFKVINTRGFNSTSPVRSLQIIDGVDNQSPGLNFSLGNFLGAPELDVLKVDLIQGASSAYYGPNAFNGVIAIQSKDPFYKKGLSASVKVGERNMLEGAVRWADVVSKDGKAPWMAYKINLSYLTADDWEATNYDPIDDSRVPADNPGRYDAVNIYGDEYNAAYDLSTASPWTFQGLGTYYRTGYKEEDLVNYDTENLKGNFGFQFRLKPELEENSPELLASTSYANGTTIYQGDNRFALKNIQFFQHKLEVRQRDKYFVRAYMTHEDAGDSYDPYFTALALQDSAGTPGPWSSAYIKYWQDNIIPVMLEEGYPKLQVVVNPDGTVSGNFDREAAEKWKQENHERLLDWHNETREFADSGENNALASEYYAPGTERFNELFNRIISRKNNEDGTLFFDKSALYHIHGEYHFTPKWIENVIVGANTRLYRPNSEGTIFRDETEKISNSEFGIYAGGDHSFLDKKLRLSATLRMDKNQNFDYLFSPAASLVYKPAANNFLRLSFSSAIRNPTLSDQYLNLNVGRAILSGNLDGVQDLLTVESLRDFINTENSNKLVYFDIDPIRPEKVKTGEIGYRTTLFNSMYVDAGYYFSQYNDFIGYNIGVDATFDSTTGRISDATAYRYSANSNNTVQTQGFSIGSNYYFADYFSLNGNYSWNKLVKTDEDDPIIPAFNTPEHKYNIGLSARNIPLSSQKHLVGFNVNYKWIDSFIFEGSPQFTGRIPEYALLDAQFNYTITDWHLNIKLGASNLLNNRVFQTYGGPRIGRLAYVTLIYDFEK